MLRIGCGYDVHRLAEGGRLVLGGVEIPFFKGLLGHSDADVLLHAVCDALLGAAAMGDVGVLFPDSDERYKDAASLTLLESVVEKLKKAGYSVVNVDCVLTAQRPKIQPFVAEMRENIARACGVAPEFISVKATTEEGLGFTGVEEGMAARAICLIEN